MKLSAKITMQKKQLLTYKLKTSRSSKENKRNLSKSLALAQQQIEIVNKVGWSYIGIWFVATVPIFWRRLSSRAKHIYANFWSEKKKDSNYWSFWSFDVYCLRVQLLDNCSTYQFHWHDSRYLNSPAKQKKIGLHLVTNKIFNRLQKLPYTDTINSFWVLPSMKASFIQLNFLLLVKKTR